jgi:hypothetical protein
MTTSRKFVVGMLFLWGVTGLIEPHTPNAGEPFNEIAFVQMIVWAVLMFGWVKAHAKLNQISPPTGAPLLAALLPPVGVPYYAFRGYGLLRGAKLVGLSLLTMILLFAVYLALFEVSASIAA